MLSENSFATVEYADEYHSSQLDGEEWSTYGIDLKEKSLNSSYSQISTFCTWDFEAGEASEKVKIAQCELAYNLAKIQSGTVKKSKPLKALKAGPVKFDFFEEEIKEDNSEPFSDYIKKLLSEDCSCTFESNFYLGTVEF